MFSVTTLFDGGKVFYFFAETSTATPIIFDRVSQILRQLGGGLGVCFDCEIKVGNDAQLNRL